MNERIKGLSNEGTKEQRMKEWIMELINEDSKSKWMNERLKEIMNEGSTEQINERTNKWPQKITTR